MLWIGLMTETVVWVEFLSSLKAWSRSSDTFNKHSSIHVKNGIIMWSKIFYLLLKTDVGGRQFVHMYRCLPFNNGIIFRSKRQGEL